MAAFAKKNGNIIRMKARGIFLNALKICENGFIVGGLTVNGSSRAAIHEIIIDINDTANVSIKLNLRNDSPLISGR